jgi:hypothetical protein
MDTLRAKKPSYAKTKYLAALVLGAFFGSLATWVVSYREKELENLRDYPSLKDVFEHADLMISKENFHCEEHVDKSVAGVLAAIIGSEMHNVRSRLSYGCDSAEDGVQRCSFGISSCKPWRDWECGSLYLTFMIDKNQKIIPSTMSCVETP